MLTVTRNNFLKRLNSLPESIRAFAFSIEIGGILRSIAAAHHLDDRKSNQILAVTAGVFFGFVHRTDFAKEIADTLKLDMKIADSIADEIGRKVFAQIQTELDRFYQPTLTSEERENTAISVSERAVKPELSTPVFLKPRPVPAPVAPTPSSQGTANAPFVLHEEKSVIGEVKKDSMKGFSLPFGLFKPKAPEGAAPKASVEAPRTIHYSEYRTNLTPGAGGEFINLETFGKISAAPKVAPSAPPLPSTPPPTKTPIVMPSTTATPTPEATLQIKKTQAAPLPARTQPISLKNESSPKVEGNTVDLR